MKNRRLPPLLLLSALTFAAQIAQAQAIPQATNVGRIKVNRTLFPETDNNASLVEQVKQTGADVTVERGRTEGAGPHETPGTTEDNTTLKFYAKYSDLVVIGTVTDKLSSLTTNDAWIVTNNTLHVSEVLKGTVSPSLLEDGGSLNDITVVVSGGDVKSQGHVIHAIDAVYQPLTIGHTYLLFLKYVPKAHSYMPLGESPGYDVTGEQISSVSRDVFPENVSLLSNKAGWLAAARSSIEHQKLAEAK